MAIVNSLNLNPANPLSGASGGTGVSNSGKTITLGANFTTSGANNLTLTTTGVTNVTLPTSGTLVDTGVTTLSSLSSIGTVNIGVWNATAIGIAYGGTGQTTASAGFGALSPLTTKGDLLSFSTVNARLPVGTDGFVLTADSASATGIKWAAVSSSGGYNTIQNNATPLTQRTELNFAGTGLVAADDAVNSRTNVTLASGISGWNGYNTNGILTQTASNTYTGRTLAGTSNRLTVTNGDGVSGNPTFDISSSYVGQNTITTLGTITTGTWNSGVIEGTYGGTGVNNGARTITLGGNLTTSGAFNTTLTVTGATNVTLPTTGTLVNTAVTALSSLATVGTITSGTWNAGVIAGTYGGTGVNNGSNTITLAGNFATSGANSLTLTTTGATNVTLPTMGTLVNTTVTALSSLATVGTVTAGTWSSNLQSYTETHYAESQAANFTFNFNNGNTQTLTLTGNVTIAFSNIPATANRTISLTLYLKQDGTGSRTPTFPASVIWPGGTTPTWSTAASACDMVVLQSTNNGTTWRSAAILSYAS